MYLSYQDEPFRSYVAEAMNAEGLVRKRFGDGEHRFSYVTGPYAFREIVEDHFRTRNMLPDSGQLENLHEYNSLESLTVDGTGQSQVSSSLYDISGDFYEKFVAFLKDEVRTKLFDFDFYFQRQPTFRCSIPDSPGYNWRPNFHTDIAIGHPPEEINFWIPVTECKGNNSLVYAGIDDSIEVWKRHDCNFAVFHSLLDREDELFEHCTGISGTFDGEYGEGLLFDSRVMHLHQRNDTSRSRVSFDFRIIPVHTMDSREVTFVGTGRKKSEFVPGDYYDSVSIDNQ